MDESRTAPGCSLPAPGGPGGFDRNLHETHLHFLGRALADAAHDVQNHLAIIEESAGWMQDLLALRGGGWLKRLCHLLERSRRECGETGRLGDILDEIRGQVREAALCNRSFSRFAHLMEEEQATFDANEALAGIRNVIEDLGTESGVHIDLRLAGDVPALISTDPSALLSILFASLRGVAARRRPGDHVTLETEVRGNRIFIAIGGAPPGEDPAAGPKEQPNDGIPAWIRDVVAGLGGEVAGSFCAEDPRRVLSFPLAQGLA